MRLIVLFFLAMIMIFYKCNFNMNSNKIDDKGDLEGEILKFVKTNQFKTVSLKSDIPNYIFEIIKKSHDSTFIIADSSEYNQVSFSDAKLSGSGVENYKYNKLIKFVLFNKDNFIMVYTEGGIGTHDAVIYYCEENQNEYLLYRTPKMINNLNDLREFIEEGDIVGNLITY